MAKVASQQPTTATAEPSLTQNQTDAIQEIIKQLDGNAPRKTVALLGPRESGKTTLLIELLEGAKPRRTLLNRKIVGFVADALLLDTRLTPWIQLVNSVLDKLTDLAQANNNQPPITIANLKQELRELARLEMRDDDAAKTTGDLASAAFASNWRKAFPRLVMDVVLQNNATLVVGLDNLEQIAPVQAQQLLDATKYFLNVAGCTTVLVADGKALVEKLDQASAGADGEAMLNLWASKRIELKPSASLLRSAGKAAQTSVAPTLTHAPARSVGADDISTSKEENRDTPPSVKKVLAQTHDENSSIAQWRAAMRGLVRRTQEGQPSAITKEMMAKVVALRFQSSALFDAARFDAAMLVGLERRVNSNASRLAEVGNEFDKVIATDERLQQLFKMQPAFGSVDTRDLATALRLAYTEQPISESQARKLDANHAHAQNSSVFAGVIPSLQRGLHNTTSAIAGAMPQVEIPAEWLSVSNAIATALSLGAGVFIVDRVLKLAALGGALPLHLSTPDPASNLFNAGVAIAADLVGIALAALAFLFWGRKRKLKAAALGLVLGGLCAGLVDRLAYGAVINYLAVGNLPYFNLAQVGLAVGAVLLLLAVLFSRTPKRRVG